MSEPRMDGTVAQLKALSHPVRLRVIRLCNDRELTNKELADRLGRDPATMLHHVRLLVDAGLLEPVAVRQGPSGAYEKPYRSTGLSWRLRFEHAAPDEDQEGHLALLTAFSEELAQAGNDAVAGLVRFHLHLDDEEVKRFGDRLIALVDEYQAGDGARRDAGAPGYGGLVVVHRLAGASGESTA